MCLLLHISRPQRRAAKDPAGDSLCADYSRIGPGEQNVTDVSKQSIMTISVHLAKESIRPPLLEVCLDLGFPVEVLERSPLVLRDLNLLKAINQQSVENAGLWPAGVSEDLLKAWADLSV
jgi:hypothetical protein